MRVLLLVLAVAAAASAAIIQPRPVDNRRDPHDGEPFEWEPVDDDPWPGPSFSFAQLPGVDDVGVLADSRPSNLADARVRAALLMQVLRAVFNNGRRGQGGQGAPAKPVSSNEVLPAWQQQQKSDKRGDRNRQ
ncbi:uncharacterized protein LOC117649339 [Thrips palmi]|uniref:Uncharacterized protein LOC117649339 n=1 Tax=Thrips palmi TaxID=161013 RepID=A0A6P8ZRR9_THRPL|nr:uncharacterized protein LOC117649339 [Thrips palmi]XP_034247882.1 uncharacterized protein LOC117649339 [Thrips palmi]XP_034247883.1 uncharacterized protein LOC117649339 [Thrips palmi]XP_034247884.1 uncharacterized protein LOC117649339 [Thrips palmi]